MTNQNTAIGLVVFVVILAIGALIITNVDTATRTTEDKTVTNESIAALNNATANQLDNTNLVSITHLINSTNDVIITAANYTADLTLGTILINSTAPFNASAAVITYVWRDTDTATAASNITLAGRSMYQNMTGLIPVLGIVFLAGIVIFFVIRSLGGSGSIAAGGGKPMGGNF